MAEKTIYINSDIYSAHYEYKGSLDKMKAEILSLNLQNNDILVVKINCFGGEIFEAISMRDYLKSLGNKIKIIISGICASAATIIALAFDDIEITETSMAMFHRAQGCVYGNSKDLIKGAKIMKKIDDEIIQITKNKAIIPINDIDVRFDEEWWLNAKEFREYFGAKEIEENTENVTNNFSKTRFTNVLEKYKKMTNKKNDQNSNNFDLKAFNKIRNEYKKSVKN